ncbi:hypothetical protein [Nocardia sp. NPDC049707]|uniref:hypothetical protein n=1 Tax=Nocardia sp. NPDC049707 TaxID=3154735 RepID=UPI0034340ADA
MSRHHDCAPQCLVLHRELHTFGAEFTAVAGPLDSTVIWGLRNDVCPARWHRRGAARWINAVVTVDGAMTSRRIGFDAVVECL